MHVTNGGEASSSGHEQIGVSLGSRYFWAFTVVWNLFVGFMLFGVLTGNGDGSIYYKLLYGLLSPFILIGIGSLSVAGLKLFRYWKYRSSTFLLDTAVLGGPLEGTLMVPEQLHRDTDAMHIRLVCNRIINERNNRKTVYVWRGVETIPASEWTRSDTPSMKSISIEMMIPYIDEVTDPSRKGEYRWMLETHAVVPGLDYSLSFPVSVRETDRSDPELTEEDILDRQEIERPEELDTLSFESTGNGFRFSNPSGLLTYPTLLNLLKCIIGGVLIGSVYPLYLVLPDSLLPYLLLSFWGLGGLAAMVSGFRSLFQSMHVRISPDAFRIKTTGIGSSKETVISPDDIQEINIEMSTRLLGKLFYYLEIKTGSDTHQTTLLSPDKQVMEYLVHEMQDVFDDS